ncbi:hypothetical protein Pint_17563 [Pistacia integerrima]|uniref:Uncharacterized protein n=1 Tax=Pistacia integerrima TaxID=434235 RepID=A0ACC0Z0A7_9ROSI|nr:hypothetical protein Pint_17563 [Pistacia integerrima]
MGTSLGLEGQRFVYAKNYVRLAKGKKCRAFVVFAGAQLNSSFNQRPSLSIHIIVFEPPYDAGSTAPYINKVYATIPSIIFHHLPTITLPPSIISSCQIPETLTFEVLLLNNPNLHQALVSISNNYTIFAFIADFFCYAAQSVTVKFNFPTYEFFTSGAGCLSLMLCFPTIHKNTTKSFKDMDNLLHIPGIPPMPAKDMPQPFLERDDNVYQYFLDATIQLPRSAGIIVNTFESLEPRALKAMTDGLGAPDGPLPPLPSLYCIGPLVASDNRGGSSHGGGGVDKQVRELMNSEEGDSVRKQTKAMKNEAKAALNKGGSSCVALFKLFESWKLK